MRPLGFVLVFLFTSAVTTLVITAIRVRDPVHILRETARFFATVVVGIGILALVVVALEWIFVRPLL